MKAALKVVHNNCQRRIILSVIVTLKVKDFQQCGGALIEEQILIKIFTIHRVPVLLQAMKLFNLCFAWRQP